MQKAGTGHVPGLQRPMWVLLAPALMRGFMTIWESQEAFQAARPAMIEALKVIPFDEWETRPREFHTLNALW